jgi:hypothetical protein
MTPRNPIELANAYRGKSGRNSLKESRSIKRSRIIYSYACVISSDKSCRLENPRVLKTQSNRERPNKRRKSV